MPGTDGSGEDAICVSDSMQNPSIASANDAMAGGRPWGDGVFHAAVLAAALFVLASLGGAALAMLWKGRAAFATFGWHFIVSTDWNPVAHQFGALVPIYGTLVTSAIGIVLAVPVSLGIAVFLTELAPRWLAGPLATAIELLAGIPSIVYGMWGLFVFVPLMSDYIEPWLQAHLGPVPLLSALVSGPPLGIGMLTAGIILGIMIIPFISSVMREVLQVVPRPLKESGFAVGSTTWEVIWDICLPYTRSAVIGGIFLGLGRALGETMAVTFVLGNAHNLGLSLLAPGNSIAAVIANEFTEADSDIYLSSLIAIGFLLFVVTFIVLALAKLLLLRLARREGR
jgi:phosphate transport system permease protein